MPKDNGEIYKSNPKSVQQAEQSYDKAHGISSYHLQETEQAEQEPVAERKAQVNELIKESAKLILSISDEGDRYLTAVDTLRNAYRLGFKDATPVRTKDLTDEDLNKLLDYWSEDERSAYGGAWRADGEYVDMKSFARAVIAADREKNK